MANSTAKFRKVSILASILLLCVFFSSAQSPSIKWSKKYKENNDFLDLECGDQTGVYTLRKERTVFRGNVSKIFVEKFDLTTMEMAYSTAIVLPEGKGQDSFVRNVILIDGIPYVIIVVDDSKAEKKVLYAQKLDSKSGALMGDRKLVAESNNSSDFYGKVFIQSSTDKKTALVWLVKEWGNDKKKWKFEFMEINSALEIISSANVEFDELGKYFDLFDPLLQDHKVYALASSKTVDPKKTAINTPNSLYKIDLKDKTLKKAQLSIPGMYSFDCKIRVSEQGNINVCGLSSDKQYKEVEGYFWIMDSKTKNCFVNVFDKDLTMKKEQALNMAPKGDEYIKNLEIKDALVRKDGSMYIVMERGYGTYSTFEFQDLYVVFVNPTGEIAWNKQIKREEVSVLPGLPVYIDFYSVQSMLYEDKLLLVYSDHIKNINLDAATSMPDAPALGKYPFFTTLDPSGSMAKTFLNVFAGGNTENIRIYRGRIIDSKIVVIGEKFERIATISVN
jgi:hypothetical protein